jgi:hypothetical protein
MWVSRKQPFRICFLSQDPISANATGDSLLVEGRRATRSLEGKSIWTGERSDLRDSI